jgi:hypothetical protein
MRAPANLVIQYWAIFLMMMLLSTLVAALVARYATGIVWHGNTPFIVTGYSVTGTGDATTITTHKP